MYDQAVDGLRGFIDAQKIGAGINPDVTMGPLNMKRQRDYVEELLAERDELRITELQLRADEPEAKAAGGGGGGGGAPAKKGPMKPLPGGKKK